jgi:hypothetical protein
MKTQVRSMFATSAVATALIAAQPVNAQPEHARSEHGDSHQRGPHVTRDPNDVVVRGKVMGRDPDPFIRGQIERGYGLMGSQD